MKIVINDCYGGYGLSEEFLDKYGKEFIERERNDPELIAAIEEFGEIEASDEYACLSIVEIPDDCTDYHIHEYNGEESVIFVRNGKLFWA